MFGLGFTRESICGRKIIHLENRVVDYFISKLSSFALLLCHCAMESNDPIVSNKVANQLNGQLEGYIGSRARNPYDYAAVFHVLNHTSYCSNVRINLCRCSLRDNQLKELTDILSSANGKLQVRVLTLFENKLTDKGILDLFTSAPSSFKSLKSPCLNSNGITNVTPLFTACNCLTNLSLSDNPLRVLGVQSLDISVKAGTLACLTDLYLSNTLTNDADINGALLTTFLQSLASHCPQLRYLDLSRNNLSVPGAYALGETFPSLTFNRSRFELDLSGTNLNESITAFSNIIATKASKQSCSCRLKISHNLLGCDGLLAVFRILRKKMCHVVSLYLQNIITTDIHYAHTNSLLSDAPALDSSKLSFLSLSNNCFSGSRVILLAECIRICTSLERLLCWRCSLSSPDIINLLTHLKEKGISHMSLREWFLRGNTIDDEGVTALINSLPEVFPSLENINLDDNPVSDEKVIECMKVS